MDCGSACDVAPDPGIRLLGQTAPRPSYSAGPPVEENRTKSASPEIQRHIRAMLQKPGFTAVVDTRQGDIGLEDTIQSIRGQLYPFLESAGPVRCGSILSARRRDDSDRHDARGHCWGFHRFPPERSAPCEQRALRICRRNQPVPRHRSHLRRRGLGGGWGGRREPFHKPSWSPDYLETFNYIGFPACFRTAIARACFGNAHLYDMVLRFTELSTKALHVPKILGHSVGKVGMETGPLVNGSAQDIIGAFWTTAPHGSPWFSLRT